jgi:hypothetical protein
MNLASDECHCELHSQAREANQELPLIASGLTVRAWPAEDEDIPLTSLIERFPSDNDLGFLCLVVLERNDRSTDYVTISEPLVSDGLISGRRDICFVGMF